VAGNSPERVSRQGGAVKFARWCITRDVEDAGDPGRTWPVLRGLQDPDVLKANPWLRRAAGVRREVAARLRAISAISDVIRSNMNRILRHQDNDVALAARRTGRADSALALGTALSATAPTPRDLSERAPRVALRGGARCSSSVVYRGDALWNSLQGADLANPRRRGVSGSPTIGAAFDDDASGIRHGTRVLTRRTVPGALVLGLGLALLANRRFATNGRCARPVAPGRCHSCSPA